MKISVIVPVYNVCDYLDRCVESILSQTFRDYELILVDDGSTDGSGKMCDSYSDERIKVIHKENGGQSSAKNVGLDVCSGERIMFVDSDDCISQYCLEIMTHVADNTGADLVQCCNDRVRGSDIVTEAGTGDVRDLVSDENSEILSGRELLFRKDFKVVPWGKLYRSELFRDIRFPEGRYNEDYAIMYRLVYPLEKVALVGKCLYHYTVRKNSLTGVFSEKLLDQLDFIDEKLAFYRENNEKQLYDNALREKAYYILTCYHSALPVYGRSSEICRGLKDKYLDIYPEVRKLDNISARNKLSLSLARFRPEAWVGIGRLADKVRGRGRC
ncbi:MAG: glycosyltransferase [Lachnospiraceae bacterium]|nr:glycosyltransferase [Lachnospiraceae bacterium]